MDTEYNKNESLPWEEDSNPKKKIKPSLVISVCIASLISVMAIGTLLAFSMVKSTAVTAEDVPQVVSIQQLDNYPVSLYEIAEETLQLNYDDKLETDFSYIGYKYKVTLDNGREIILSPGARIYNIGSSRAFLELNGYIYTNNLGEIIRNDDGTVDITVSAKIRSVRRYHQIISETTSTFKKEIVDCIVKDLRFVGNTSVLAYKDCDHFFVDNAEFEITYGDGRKVVAKPEISENGTYQTLDGHRLESWTNDDNEDGADDSICVSILDFPGICETKLTEKEYPFSSVEITDCTFDESYKITSLSYTVTYKDGTVRHLKNQTPVESGRSGFLDFYEGSIFTCLDGYYVIAEPEFVFLESAEKTEIKLTLTIGFISDEHLVTTKVFTTPESDCECLCHNNGKTEKKLYTALKTIMEFLAINEYCKCGIHHYEISEF